MSLDKYGVDQTSSDSVDDIEELDLEAFYADADLTPPDESFLIDGAPPDAEEKL